MDALLKKEKGITLIELLVALVISSILVAGLYRTLIGQQKTFNVQDQTVDMQQNMRAAINRMMTEIRMAGFGNLSMVLPVTFGLKTFNNVLNLDDPSAGALTIITALDGTASLTVAVSSGQNQVTVSTLTDGLGNALFDLADRKYVSIGGLESYVVSAIDNATKTITLQNKDGSAASFSYNHPVGTPLFHIRALSYQVASVSGIPTLLRDENLGAGAIAQADGIETLQFTYLDANGNPTLNPPDIRIIRVTLTARAEKRDPDLKNGDGYRRRQIASSIHLRNMGISP